MARQLLTAEALNVEGLMARADSGTTRRGIAYSQQGRVRLVRVEREEAEARVTGSEVYQVLLEIEDKNVYGTCNCPISDGDPEIVCKHQVAAALILRNYLRAHPPQTWETVLAQAVKAEPRRSTPSARQVLFFSLQMRHSTWAVYPYSLPLSHFAEGTIGDADALAKTIKQEALSKQAKPLRSQLDPRRFVSASGDDTTALNLVSLAGQISYSYYYERSFECRAILPLLAGGFIFKGREQDPLQIPLRVSGDTGTAQVELTQMPEGTALHSFITLGDRKFPLTPEKTAVVSEDPLWLLSSATLYPVEEGAGLVATLLDNPDLIVPLDETQTFFDKFLLPLAERVPVTGDGIVWEEEEIAEPVPRLYLSEADGTLLVLLRFGYGATEVAYDKALPETMLTRKAETRTLIRLTRRPEQEQRWWEAVSGNGLKRGGEPDQFVLRAKTDPVDFLLTHVPRLTEAGFEIYGERALTSARVNRSRPTIAFNVSSGIDWFDVDAVIHFGDTEVKLKEVRRAVRRSERYVKLADGSIGEIPAEWLENYRYLFSMAEESGDGLRLASSQVTLLDQLLMEGDRIQADEEFGRRRDNLRRFSEIEPRELPVGLKANLRPYQKAGFDWLHFLHEYGFGGCLADDMGTGKTLQTLALLQSFSESHEVKAASLLVLPRSLVFNWEREAARFTPGLRLLNHAQATRAKELASFDEYDLVLTTYGILLRDIEMLRQHRFHYVILDEAQAIKNPVSQSAKAARLLQADHKLTLTGTPVENSTLELWSQFAFPQSRSARQLGALSYRVRRGYRETSGRNGRCVPAPHGASIYSAPHQRSSRAGPAAAYRAHSVHRDGTIPA